MDRLRLGRGDLPALALGSGLETDQPRRVLFWTHSCVFCDGDLLRRYGVVSRDNCAGRVGGGVAGDFVFCDIFELRAGVGG